MEVTASGCVGVSAVPSGASTGEFEALELRDNDNKRFNGKGVKKAVHNIINHFAPALIGEDASNQQLIDDILLSCDGTPNKSKYGANASLGISMASAVVSANFFNKPLYKHLNNFSNLMPVPMINVLNGGMHADKGSDLQEIMLFPHGINTFSDSIRMGSEIFHQLQKELKKQGFGTTVGDEGGFAPSLKSNSHAIEMLLSAIESSGYKVGSDVSLALDVAASSFYKNGIYSLKVDGNNLDSDGMIRFYENLINQYPIISIEDGLDENDWEGWKYLTSKIGDRTQLVGDDLFVTQEKILQKGINDKCANSVLIKVNQVGSISETIETMQLAKENNYTSMVSHRSGETEDAFISHLVVGTSSGQIKTGAPARGERTAKYNELLRISEQVGSENFDNQKWQK